MKILHQLDRPNFKASKSDKILIRYIKEHAEEFCTTPIASLAINCGVSEATITRFVRKMGFASLQLFKLTLTEEMVNNKQRTIISKDITCDESIIITANKLLANNIATLEQTVSGLDEDILLKSVNMLKKAERIFFIGLGILFYGIAYFLVHDVLIHKRFKWFNKTNNAYLVGLRKGHKVHHKHLGKEEGECFGMLFVPLKYFKI